MHRIFRIPHLKALYVISLYNKYFRVFFICKLLVQLRFGIDLFFVLFIFYAGSESQATVFRLVLLDNCFSIQHHVTYVFALNIQGLFVCFFRFVNCAVHCVQSPLSSFYFLHSLKMVCVSYSSHFPSSIYTPAFYCTHNPLLTQNNHSLDTDKMLLTARASHSSTRQNNVWSFSSSLAVNPAHVLMKKINPHE